MSALVERAIGQAGLDEVARARRAGPLSGEHLARLRAADLLVLGALADRVRADEVGDEVRIFTGESAADDDGVTVLPADGPAPTGLDLLRQVALARLSLPRGARIRIEWTRCGLELAQIALGFGASELAGRISDKRGLPLAEDDVLGVGKKSRLVSAEAFKRRELEGLVRRAGRTPSFAQENQ